LHFDANYRVDSLRELFGSGGEEDLQEEESAKATNTYKRADLYKMHTYNDAIRRTVGSYVLYPGSGPSEKQFSKYHEILPGVGAFSLSPGDPERRAALRNFIADALASQSDRFTQLARINYWTHDTVREEPVRVEHGGLASHGRPPKDSSVVLGYLRPDENPDDYRARGVFYCHAVEWEKDLNSCKPGKPTRLEFDPFRAELLGVFQKKVAAPWLAKIRDVKMVTAAERAAELGRPENAMRAAYYYKFTFEDPFDELPRDVSSIVPVRPSQPVGCTLAQFAGCHPVI